MGYYTKDCIKYIYKTKEMPSSEQKCFLSVQLACTYICGNNNIDV